MAAEPEAAAGPDCDPQLLRFVADRAALLDGQWFGDLTPQEARRSFDAIAAWNRHKLSEPPPVGQISEHEILTGTTTTRLRVYRPAGAPATGTVVFFHGGGFVFGSVDSYDEVTRMICRRSRTAVVSVEYPLAPEHRFPSQVDVGLAAVRWALDQGDALSSGGQGVVLTGDSAGGTIATAVALACAREGRVLAGQVLAYAPFVHVDLTEAAGVPAWDERRIGFGPSAQSMRWYWSNYVPDESAVEASPLLAPDLSLLPPTVVVVAALDSLHSEGVRYAARLRDAGVSTVLRDFDRINHGFLVHGWLPADQRSPVAHDASLVVCDDIRRLASAGAASLGTPSRQ